jgi:hypothetical protein
MRYCVPGKSFAVLTAFRGVALALVATTFCGVTNSYLLGQDIARSEHKHGGNSQTVSTVSSSDSSGTVQLGNLSAGSHAPSLHRSVIRDNQGGTNEFFVLSVCLGQSMNDVRKAMGDPDSMTSQEGTVVLVYNGVKISFVNERVSHVE